MKRNNLKKFKFLLLDEFILNMKNKTKKEIKKKIHYIFWCIKRHKCYRFFVKKPFIIRLILGFLFIFLSIIAYIVPFIPFATVMFIFWLMIIFDPKKTKSKLLYILNKLRIKYFFIKIYIYFKIKKNILKKIYKKY